MLYDCLYACHLTPESSARTCGPYRYVVTAHGHTPHTAFRTRPAFVEWLGLRGLTLPSALETPGDCANIHGSYRRVYEWDEAVFAALGGVEVVELSNGSYTGARITTDTHGLRTVHVLNPNVRTRPEYDYRVCREREDAGDYSIPRCVRCDDYHCGTCHLKAAKAALGL